MLLLKIMGKSIMAKTCCLFNFSWVYSTSYNTTYYSESYSGMLNSLSTPSSIEGTVYRGYYGIFEHGYTLKFVMSRQ